MKGHLVKLKAKETDVSWLQELIWVYEEHQNINDTTNTLTDTQNHLFKIYFSFRDFLNDKLIRFDV
jgi:hypothetical protein